MSLSPLLVDCAVSLFDSSVIHTHLPFLLGATRAQGLGLFCVFTNSHNLARLLGRLLEITFHKVLHTIWLAERCLLSARWGGNKIESGTLQMC